MQQGKKGGGIYETNLTANADALRMRWNLIAALYLQGKE